jgi:hypothetical protein
MLTSSGCNLGLLPSRTEHYIPQTALIARRFARNEVCMDVGEWMGGLGLQQYAKAFAENGIDCDVLKHLTGEDLKELGVELLGHRRKLLTAIEALHSRPAAVPAPGRDAQMNSPPAQASVSPQRRHLTVLFSAPPPCRRGSIRKICVTSSAVTMRRSPKWFTRRAASLLNIWVTAH